jgi:predicted Fe-S protein YdhL (DUF1289 family)
MTDEERQILLKALEKRKKQALKLTAKNTQEKS